MFLLKKHIICESFGQTKPPILTFKASHYEIDDFIISNSRLISFPQVSKIEQKINSYMAKPKSVETKAIQSNIRFPNIYISITVS